MSQIREEPSLHYLTGDFVIVGDLNGGILDLLRIFHDQGSPRLRPYLFLGNLVNVAEFSIQVVTLLAVAKILWPENVYILRGSQECTECCAWGGFREELVLLYVGSNSVYRAALALFEVLPLEVVLNKTFFCVSGGIGPNFADLKMIAAISRPVPAEKMPIVNDLCWSEPTSLLPIFLPSVRGFGTLFGADAIDRFLRQAELKKVIRFLRQVLGR
jgi:hypothetical protein